MGYIFDITALSTVLFTFVLGGILSYLASANWLGGVLLLLGLFTNDNDDSNQAADNAILYIPNPSSWCVHCVVRLTALFSSLVLCFDTH